jgi:hypothetical protein
LHEKSHLTYGQIADKVYDDSNKGKAARSACERLKDLREKRYQAYLTLKERCSRLGLVLHEEAPPASPRPKDRPQSGLRHVR